MNPGPDQWRLKTPDELFDVTVHELGHANANVSSIKTGGYGRHQVPSDIVDDYYRMVYSGDPDWKNWTQETRKPRLESYVYGLQNHDEMIAELHRFYLRGVSSTTAHGGVGEVLLSAEQWRSQNPILADWVREKYGL